MCLWGAPELVPLPIRERERAYRCLMNIFSNAEVRQREVVARFFARCALPGTS